MKNNNILRLIAPKISLFKRYSSTSAQVLLSSSSSSSSSVMEETFKTKSAATPSSVVDFATLLAPPNASTMKVLNREFFKKDINLSAAILHEPKDMQLAKKAFLPHSIDFTGYSLRNIYSIFAYEGSPKKKKILLSPAVDPDDLSTLNPEARALVDDGKAEISRHVLNLKYEDWDAGPIINAIIPEDLHHEVPTGFEIAGHIAHFNLKNEYLPYKNIIGQVIIDKNPKILTVVNKIEDVGVHSEFRTFPMEIIAGKPNFKVTLVEQDCTFDFDFESVYWNSRLNFEHERMVDNFQEGEVVCDVMAGVGPFAIPAAKKKKVYVWANDLNPASFASIVGNIKKNHLIDWVRPFNLDGREFIRRSTLGLIKEGPSVISYAKNSKQRSKWDGERISLSFPCVFQHFVLNLPASAVEFVDAFQGCYRGEEKHFTPHTLNNLPLIHVYTFNATKDMKKAAEEICAEISHYLGYKITVDKVYADEMQKKVLKRPPGSKDVVDERVYKEDKAKILFVRMVSPKRSMYCASFRLPAAVAFKDSMTKEEKETFKRKENWKIFTEQS